MGESPGSGRDRTSAPRRRPAFLWAAGVGVVVMALAGIALFRIRSTRRVLQGAENRRDQFIAITDSLPWEFAMGILAIAFLWASFQAEPMGIGPARLLETALTLVFLAEFATRLVASRDRTEYLVDHWIDALALLPAVRGLRVLRLLRIVRLAAGVHRATLRVWRLERVQRLLTLVIAWVVVMLIGAVSFYAGELGVNPAVDDFSDAPWWAVTTITGGQSEIVAMTEDGRWAAVTLLVAGVAVFAALTAGVFALFSGEANAEPETDDLAEEMSALVSSRREGLLSSDALEERILALVSGDRTEPRR
jgi:hypothetical protein